MLASGIRLQDEGLRETPAVHGQLHGVAARRGWRWTAAATAATATSTAAASALRRRRTQIPDEAMHASRRRQSFLRPLPHRVDDEGIRIDWRDRIGARVAAHGLTGTVQDLEYDGPGRRRTQVVIDDRADRRALSPWFVLLGRRAIVGRRRQNDRVRRFEQERV